MHHLPSNEAGRVLLSLPWFGKALRKARAVWTTGAEAFFQGSEQRDCGGWGQVGCGSELVEKDTVWLLTGCQSDMAKDINEDESVVRRTACRLPIPPTSSTIAAMITLHTARIRVWPS
ncbi:hypothetical protein KCU88_g132, partial [Aureobasidium melanogenum]